MFKRLVVVAVLLVVLVPVSGAFAQGGLVAVGDTVEGSLDGGMALYKLALEAGQMVSIGLASEDFDAYLRLQDKAGMDLASDDDSGGGLNSRLLYTAPESATYTVVVGSFADDGAGAYTLTVSTAEITQLAYGDAVPVSMNNETLYFMFQGAAGDVIDISVDNPDLDLRLAIVDAEEFEIFYNDDDGPGYAPYIRRALLPQDGTYQVMLEPVYGEAVGELTLTLEQVDLPLMDNGPVTITLTEDQSVERIGFTAEAGSAYTLSVSASQAASAYIMVQYGEYYWDGASLNFSEATGASVTFRPTRSGVIMVEVDDNSYTTVDYELSVAAAD
jgi:hypothetical protein